MLLPSLCSPSDAVDGSSSCAGALLDAFFGTPRGAGVANAVSALVGSDASSVLEVTFALLFLASGCLDELGWGPFGLRVATAFPFDDMTCGALVQRLNKRD